MDGQRAYDQVLIARQFSLVLELAGIGAARLETMGVLLKLNLNLRISGKTETNSFTMCILRNYN